MEVTAWDRRRRLSPSCQTVKVLRRNEEGPWGGLTETPMAGQDLEEERASCAGIWGCQVGQQ